MARTYAQIKIAIWKDDDFRALDLAEQWLYQSLLSQPDLTAAGVLIYRPARWSKLCHGCTVDDINNLIARLIDKQYLVADWDSEEILIRTFVKHDGSGGNWKFRKGVQASIERIESDTLRAIAQATFDGLPPLPPPKPKGDASSTDGEPIANRSGIDEEPDNLKPATSTVNPEPSTFNLQPSSSSETRLKLAGGTDLDDDRFEQALNYVILAKAQKDPPTGPWPPWHQTVRANTLNESGPRIHEMVAALMSPFEVASEVVGRGWARAARKQEAAS